MAEMNKNFLYLTELIGISVFDISGNKIGRISDITASFGQSYPKITGLVAKRKDTLLYFPWTVVKEIKERKSVTIFDAVESTEEQKASNNDILVRKTLWDRQIVDTKGLKLVRVNDVHLLRDDLNLWLVHIDIGIAGILRRLGWIHFINPIIRWLFSSDIKERLIQWKYVQIVTREGMAGNLSINTTPSKLAQLHPADIAEIMSDLGFDERILIFRSLDHLTAVKTLQEFPKKIQKQIMDEFDDAFIIPIIKDLPVDEIVDLLNLLEKERVESLCSLLPSEITEEIIPLMDHSRNSAGSIMNTDFIAVQQNLSAGTVIDLLKKSHARSEVFYYVYAHNDDNKLCGVASLRQVILSDENVPLSSIMHPTVISVTARTHINKVARMFMKYDFRSIPVIDASGEMTGIITIKDAFNAVFPELSTDEE
jgi:magnesium transporter